ncbi:MAG TPA: RIP metalloprotease RseP, partial [Bacteroidota bacterium]
HTVTYWEDVDMYIYAVTLGNDLSVRVQRNGGEHTLNLAREDIPDIAETRFGIFPEGLLAVVTAVESGMPAEALGLQPGDIITTVNDTAVGYNDVPSTIRKFAGMEISLGWKRGEELFSGSVKPGDDGRIGIGLSATYTGQIEHLQYSLFEALPEGAADVVEMSGLFFNNIYHLFTGQVSFSKSVGGPIKIAQIATRSAEVGFISFLGFMALLSISLALINLLPFPALDGGHLMFLLFEAVFRREIPNKVKIALQQAGFFLLLVFMAFVLYNDIVNY